MPVEGRKFFWINCNRRGCWSIEAPRCNKLPSGKSFPQRNLLPARCARFFGRVIWIGCSFDCFSKRPSGSRTRLRHPLQVCSTLGLTAVAVRTNHFAILHGSGLKSGR